MKRVLLALALLGVAVGANADPTNLEGGALITHYIPDFVFSEDPCGDFYLNPLTNCDDQINRIDTTDYITATWFVVASFYEEDKEWCGAQFGLSDYDPAAFYYLAFGPCYPPDGGLEIASTNWPGPNEGSAIVVTGTPWAGNFVPLYYFHGYAYAYETLIQLVPDPTVATPFGGMGNCASPPEKWDAALGGIGINMDGTWVCGEPQIEYYVCCVGEDCYLFETEDECTAAGGEWYPDLQSCEPNPCIVEAACCLMGDCIITTASGCEAIGGEFHEEWDSCEPNPCPLYGACCFDCECELLYEEECVAQGGIFVGGECVPNPCGTPNETTSWGTIKSLYR
jgi:hypothetical protein